MIESTIVLKVKKDIKLPEGLDLDVFDINDGWATYVCSSFDECEALKEWVDKLPEEDGGYVRSLDDCIEYKEISRMNDPGFICGICVNEPQDTLEGSVYYNHYIGKFRVVPVKG